MAKSTATAQITNTNSQSLLLINQVVNELVTTAEAAELMRVDKRYPLESKVLIGTKNEDGQFVAEYEVWGVDLSNNGISFLTIRPLEAQKNFYLVMRPTRSTLIFAAVLIRRCDALTKDIYRVGATFVFEDE